MTQQSELRELLTELRSGIINFDDRAMQLITDYTNKQIEEVLDRLDGKKAYDVSGTAPLINPVEIEAERNRLKGDK